MDLLTLHVEEERGVDRPSLGVGGDGVVPGLLSAHFHKTQLPLPPAQRLIPPPPPVPWGRGRKREVESGMKVPLCW